MFANAMGKLNPKKEGPVVQGNADEPEKTNTRWVKWRTLILRCWAVDPELCPKCGKEMRRSKALSDHNELQRLLSNVIATMAAAANSGDPIAVCSAIKDAYVFLLTTPFFAEGLATLLGGGLLASVVESVLLFGGLALSTANFLATARDVVSRPRMVAIEVPVPVTASADFIGNAPDFKYDAT